MRTRAGRGIAALITAACVAMVFVPGGAGAAGAPVTDGSWFWAAQPDPLPSPIGQVAALPAPDVPAGAFPVGARAGQADKETFLHISTSDIPAGATVTAFTLTLKEDARGGNVNAAGAKIDVAAVKSFWAGGVTGAPISQAPALDESAPRATGSRAADGTWTFDITALVAMWVQGNLPNNGLALVPSAEPGATFQVTWSGTDPVPSTNGAFTPPAATTDTAAPASGGTDVVGAGTEVAPAPVAITPSPAPIVAPDTPYKPLPAVAPARAAKPTRVARPDTGIPIGFYVAGLALLAVLVLGAIALGPMGDPTPPRRGAVLRRLEQLTPTQS